MSKAKRKVQKRYELTDGGFKVVLANVPMLWFENEWTPQIDIDKVTNFIAAKIVLGDKKLTGREFAYLRKFLGLSMRSIAPLLDVKFPTIHQWEQAGESETTMKRPTELLVRLMVLESLKTKPRDFYRAFEKLKDGGGCIKREARLTVSADLKASPSKFVGECLEYA